MAPTTSSWFDLSAAASSLKFQYYYLFNFLAYASLIWNWHHYCLVASCRLSNIVFLHSCFIIFILFHCWVTLCLLFVTLFILRAPNDRLLSGERPYACDICQKRFAVKSYVTAHRWGLVQFTFYFVQTASGRVTTSAKIALVFQTIRSEVQKD